MADPVSQALQYWGGLDFERPTRDAQLAELIESLKEKKTTFSQKQQSLAAEGKYAYPEVDNELSKHISDALAPGGSLAPSPNPPPSDQGAGAMTFPFAPPANVVGTPQPLVPPGGPSTAPSPGQGSTPMQAPNMASLLPQHSQQFLSQQPPQARQAALMALLADMMKKKVTTTAPGAPTGPAPAMGTPAPQGPAGAPRSEERRVGKECRSRWSPYY